MLHLIHAGIGRLKVFHLLPQNEPVAVVNPLKSFRHFGLYGAVHGVKVQKGYFHSDCQ
jgi:hypothetical protein